MPKTTKEITKKEELVSKASVSKSKKTPASKVVSTNKTKSKTATKTTKKSTTKSNVVNKKETAKKSTSKSKVSASKSTKKTIPTTKKATSKKSPSKKIVNKKVDILEYYDLPYRYNQTIVKVLSQTPKTLFVYWDISDNDKKNYIKQYGESFFETTKPVLIIHNTTLNYSFEIEINDFANCWYFNVNDEKCEYLVELGRRPKTDNVSIPNNYLHITSSNKIESPNGHILFEKEQKTLFYRNVKTNETYSKDVANLQFIKHFGRIYNIYEMYKEIYKKEDLTNLNNPSSKFN
ncbi:MAG: DUF4912 domain-containing protein [Clostridia bacterium]|nr:DUF4912 domain-containing protein [Clostridia bacterium]